MARWRRLALWAPLALLALSGVAVAQEGEEEWGYRNDEPSRWSSRFPECGASRQSPILLDGFDAEWTWPRPGGDRVRVDLLDYGQRADGELTNNGHTVNLKLNYTSRATTPRVVVRADGNSATYFFDSLHFHWPSEHRFPYQSFPLELHMVHRDDDGDILVLGYLFDACDFAAAPSGLSVVAAAARRVPRPGDAVSLAAFAPQRLTPHPARALGRPVRACGFFAYAGSLTTPPCSEGVVWLVHGEPQCVAEWQMDAFMEVLAADGQPLFGNARPLQPRNGRSLLLLPCGAPWR